MSANAQLLVVAVLVLISAAVVLRRLLAVLRPSPKIEGAACASACSRCGGCPAATSGTRRSSP